MLKNLSPSVRPETGFALGSEIIFCKTVNEN